MKQILIINGSGGVGKDTFVNCLNKIIPTKHISIIEPVKQLAKAVGWTGNKSETERKFLSDLKLLIDEFNDYNYHYIAEIVQNFLNGIFPEELLCIDMREKFQIEKAKRTFNAKTVLVTRNSVPHILSNMADAGVFDTIYDYHIKNDKTIADLQIQAENLIKKLQKKSNYTKVIYVSHPYGGVAKNKKKIETLLLSFIKQYPNYLFLSPVHCFGFAYNVLNYMDGLNECLWLLEKADEMWVCGDYRYSKGCQAEIEFCKNHKIPFTIKSNKNRVII